MANSKHRPKHSIQLSKRKTKQKQMNQQNTPTMPEVRSIPTWASDAKIELTGLEWDAIQNGLTNIQIAQQASQAVMSRNIVSGVIGLDYEKLDPATLQYVPMTDEEKAPYIDNLNKALEAIRNPQPQATEAPTAPEVKILDATGNEIETTEQAKVVSINGK